MLRYSGRSTLDIIVVYTVGTGLLTRWEACSKAWAHMFIMPGWIFFLLVSLRLL